MNHLGKYARQRLRSRLCRRFGRGLDQIGDRFRLRQIELVVQECPVREFARLRQSQVAFLARFQTARQQHLQYYRPAVPLQFQHIFAGVGMRCLEVDRKAVVDDVAIGLSER